MSVKEPEAKATTQETDGQQNLADEALDDTQTKLVMDFGLGQQAPERMTIDVLKQLIRENPRKMAYALTQPMQASLRRAAVFLLLVSEDAARFIVTELGEHEKELFVAHVANLPPVSLGDQTAILKEFTELLLQANSSLFGDAEFAKHIAMPLPPPAVAENSESEGVK